MASGITSIYVVIGRYFKNAHGGAILKIYSALPPIEPIAFYLAPKSCSISDRDVSSIQRNCSTKNNTWTKRRQYSSCHGSEENRL